MTKDEQILILKKELQSCKKELEFLKTFPAVAQGIKGETLVARLTGGTITGYSEPHDVVVRNGSRLEVKYSHLNIPDASKPGYKRWNWVRLLGQNGRKEYDFLVLVGEKDLHHEQQYPADLPYVFFLLPRKAVDEIMKTCGLSLALNTDLKTARGRHSPILKDSMVCLGAEFTKLLGNVAAPSLSGPLPPLTALS